MRCILFFSLAWLLLTGCTKDADASGSGVAIYLLKSFTATPDSVQPVRTIISNPVPEDAPLIIDSDISYYTVSTSTFALKKDIRSVIRNFSKDKGFVVMVNHEPVYYGLFHPAVLSSLTIGLPTIDPYIVNETDLKMNYVLGIGDKMEQYDKRNDPKLTNAFASVGRLK